LTENAKNPFLWVRDEGHSFFLVFLYFYISTPSHKNQKDKKGHLNVVKGRAGGML